MKSRQTGSNIEGERVEEDVVPQEPSRFRRILTRFGVAGFLFFLIKGIVLYILLPLGLLKWLGC
jgi:hypothetical protein